MKRILLLGWMLISVLLSTGSAPIEPTLTRIAQTQKKETVVYVTRTGEKFHRSNCRYLRQSKIKTTKNEAVKNGYSACKVCKP